MSKTALILVDIQNDFLPDGALPTPDGYRVIGPANRLMHQGRFDLVVATQDWHPANHGSFASQHPGKEVGEVVDLHGLEQVLWPDHCVQGSRGAEFPGTLDIRPIEAIIRKGTDPAIDSYSGFYDNGHRKATGLGPYLKGRGVDRVYVAGIATDYCVKWTALDAVQREGLRTSVVVDATCGVNLKPGDVEAAIEEMRGAGVELVTLADLGLA
ncbi:MAG: bifunctional nicotinamidase/pyrazinamidase [Deltaproteobacteria bacterium]|nr:MAG: bifunctional nicotinamidase/pyrazinamidase [Deltaproteobacteria bacterium]